MSGPGFRSECTPSLVPAAVSAPCPSRHADLREVARRGCGAPPSVEPSGGCWQIVNKLRNETVTPAAP